MAVWTRWLTRIWPGPGLGAQAGRQVRHRADRGVVRAALEADAAERGVALRDPDAEAEVVPPLRQPAASSATLSRIATAMRTARAGASGQGSGSLKNTISPSPVKRSSVPS